MNSYLESALGFLTASGITAAVLTPFVKGWIQKGIEHTFDEKLATHKAKLARANELDVAEFKHKVQLAAAEQNFRFSRVFEKTVEVIGNTYARLVEFRSAVEFYAFTGSIPDSQLPESAFNAMRDKALAFDHYYKPN